MKPIAVIGAGSWGTALALALSRNGCITRLWDANESLVTTLKAERCNLAFGIPEKFPDTLQLFDTLPELLADIEDVLIVVPSFAFTSVCKTIKTLLPDTARIAWATKGFASEAPYFLDHFIVDTFGESMPCAMLSGPSFAKEVAAGQPTAINITSQHDAFVADLCERFVSSNFRLQRSHDLKGVQLCSVTKNILAIAAGICDGCGYAANTRAAMLAKGLQESQQLILAVGGKSETILSLAGIGDTILTCTDDQSRNRRFGLALGAGKSVQQAQQEIAQAIEGYDNAKQLHEVAQLHELSLPVFAAIHDFLYANLAIEELIEIFLSV